MDRLFAADGTGGSTALPTNNVTRAELVAFVEDIKPRSGSALAALEALATTGPVVLTDATDSAKTMSTSAASVLSTIEDQTILTGSGACDVAKRTTLLNAVSGTFTLTLANGSYNGQEHYVIFADDGSAATWTASGLTNFHSYTGFVLSRVSHSLHLKWNATTSKWAMTGGNCLVI